MRRSLLPVLLLAAVTAAAAPSLAQPAARPVTLVVPYPPGGTADSLARLLQKPLSDALNAPVLILNKAGATGQIGTDFVAKSAPDGYTILLGNQGPNAIVPAAKKTPYDPVDDFRPLTTIAFAPLLLTTGANGPKSLKEFMDQSRQQAGSRNYGSSGTGSMAHLTGFEFFRLANIDATHIPFQGGAPVMNALVGGQIQASFIVGLESAAIADSGKIRYLGTGSSKPMASLPGVPRVSDEVPGFESVIWYAMFAPKGVSDEVADRLRTAIVSVVDSAEFKKYLRDRHGEARSSSPREVAQLVRQDMARWGEVIRRGSIPMQ